MVSSIRTFLAAEAAVFGAAALVHAGILLAGHQHRQARIAESVIAGVLVVGLIGTLLAQASTRRIALFAQGFALLGTLVGAVMIAIGVGPRSTLDYALHAAMIVLLVTGLVVTRTGGHDLRAMRM